MKQTFNIDSDTCLKIQLGYDDDLKPIAKFTLLMSDDRGKESTQSCVANANSRISDKCNDIGLYVNPTKNGILSVEVKNFINKFYFEVNLNEGCFDIKKLDKPKQSIFESILKFIIG